ncbi:hypothetical protein KJ953_04660 [Patescibacteria group bacterium]|nr:hypothetical protein [Patescibacteria group bacterium]MBU1457452.1 hypothetical protein [Patescibacteria group bacterium]
MQANESTVDQIPITTDPQSTTTPIEPQTPPQQPTSPKKKPWTLISLVVLLISVTGVLGYKSYQVKQPLENQQPTPLPSSGAVNRDVTGEVYYGIFTTVSNCMIPEGCGPRYKLWDSEMKSYTPLLGNIEDGHSGLIIQVIGEKTTLPKSKYDDMNYQGPTTAIKVNSYKTLSKIAYHEFLKEKAGVYTIQNYPCLAKKVYGITSTSWDKSFGWEIQTNQAILKVRMTDTSSDKASQPYYELWYDGNSGGFVKEIKQPIENNFCNN